MRSVPFIFLLLFSISLHANVDEKLSELQKAISENQYSRAKKLFDNDISGLIDQKFFLELSYYIPYAGYIADHFGENGMNAVENLRDFIITGTDNLRVMRQAYLETHTYYRKRGKYQLAYDMNIIALELSHKNPDCEPREWAMIESNLGVLATELSRPDLAKSHVLRANKGFNLDPKTDMSNK